MKYENFEGTIMNDGTKFQIFQRDVFPVGHADANVKPNEDTFELEYTGVYMLVGVKCGPLTSYELSGQVEVRNIYGFLPGIDLPKKSFYNNLGWFYLVCAIW